MFLVRNRQFKPYWFETGTPTFLIELMEKDGFAPEKMEKLSCRDTDFSTYEVVNPASLPILFQSGYLTIYDYQESNYTYTLMGYYIKTEYKTSTAWSQISSAARPCNLGRIDAFINLTDRVYLFEFKFTDKGDGTNKMKKAGNQIKETDYAKRFLDCGKPISLLPVFKYRNERAVIKWEELE